MYFTKIIIFQMTGLFMIYSHKYFKALEYFDISNYRNIEIHDKIFAHWDIKAKLIIS